MKASDNCWIYHLCASKLYRNVDQDYGNMIVPDFLFILKSPHLNTHTRTNGTVSNSVLFQQILFHSRAKKQKDTRQIIAPKRFSDTHCYISLFFACYYFYFAISWLLLLSLLLWLMRSIVRLIRYVIVTRLDFGFANRKRRMVSIVCCGCVTLKPIRFPFLLEII